MSSKATVAAKAAKKETERKNMAVMTGTLAQVKSSHSKEESSSDSQPKRYVYRDFCQIYEEDFDVEYEIDQEGLLQALEEATALAAAQTIQHQQPMAYLAPPPPIMRASGWVRSQRFPVKLYALLSQPQLSHVITWMPHGRSWKVLEPRVFETAVLPVFFESDNYHSFNRVINAWCFRRKSSGPDRGSYFHEVRCNSIFCDHKVAGLSKTYSWIVHNLQLFMRGKPHLQKYMRRLPRMHKKLPMAKDEEPDFYELEKHSPLPTMEEAAAALELRKMRRIRDQLNRDQGHAFTLPPR